MPPKLLLDTNVWLDYFIDRSAKHDLAGKLVVDATAAEAFLLTSVSSVSPLNSVTTPLSRTRSPA